MSFLSFLCIEMAVARRLCLAQRGSGRSRGSDRTWSSLCGAQRTSADFAFLPLCSMLSLFFGWSVDEEGGGWEGRLGRGRRAWVRLCCPLNDTQSCGPAAKESFGGGDGSGFGAYSEVGLLNHRAPSFYPLRRCLLFQSDTLPEVALRLWYIQGIWGKLQW